MKRTSLRVCLDARLVSEMAGGVVQAIIGLTHGLSQLTDGDEEYLFLTYADADEWIRPYLQGPCRILPSSAAPKPPYWAKRFRSIEPLLRCAWGQFSTLLGRWTVNVPKSDGTVEQSGAAVIHFLTTNGFLTELPSIYQMYDLQHLHLPQFFRPRERLVREVLYRAFCEQARIVSVMTAWGEQDLIGHYGLPLAKVAVIPWAPVLSAYPKPSAEDLSMTRHNFSLPEAFIFYPAQTWPHKNHLGLLQALAILRDRFELTVPLICSGKLNEFFPKIERRMRELELTSQVKFLGFVSPLELQCLYRLCRCLVFPTKFEGFGMPLTEAFLAGTAAVCSNVTCLPEQAGDAALIFNPDRPGEIAQAIYSMWTDEALRQTLIERGRKSVARFSWQRTARIFRAYYRWIAGRPLTEEDRALLATRPLS